MDFDEAISAHSAWKTKLKGYLRKPDKSLNVNIVGMDNQCTLGQWLYDEGKKYSAFPEYAELRDQHADFHRAAADLAKRADAGESVSEEAALGANSPFSKLSAHVVQLIMKMKERAR